MHQSRKPTRTVAPTVAPLSLVQVKRHLALPTSDNAHDELLNDLIKSSARAFENDTGWAVMSSTYTQTYECFPMSPVALLRRPASAVSHIKYYDEAGSLQTWASSNYRLDAGGAMPVIAYDKDYLLPTIDDRSEAVVVTYTAGAATASEVPEDLADALLLLIAHRFEHRGIMHQGQFSETTRAYQSIVNSYQRSSYP